MKPKNEQTSLDFSRAKRLLDDLKSATRRSLSAQILLGKELCRLKRKLGFIRGRHVSSAKLADDGNGSNRTWPEWCKAELDGLADRTANRYIQIFDAALERAKRNKTKEPEACRLLLTPAAALTGDEVELLAACVDRLVDQETQAGLLEELGIVKPSNKTTGGDTSAHRKEKEWHALEDQAVFLFSSVTRQLGEVEKEIFSVRTHADYRFLLEELPITSDSDRKPSLMSIKECLEEILNGKIAGLVKELDAAIERKMHGLPLKRERRKSKTTAKS